MLKGKVFSQYLIGARNNYSNIKLVKKICKLLDKIKPNKSGLNSYSDLIKFVSDRPGHDVKYLLIPPKLKMN